MIKRTSICIVAAAVTLAVAAPLNANFTAGKPRTGVDLSLQGTIVAETPDEGVVYLGYPSIAVTPSGDVLVAHDYFPGASVPAGDYHSEFWRSEDAGATWTNIANLHIFNGALLTLSNQVYFAGTSNGVWLARSGDAGATWTLSDQLAVSGMKTGGNPLLVTNGIVYVYIGAGSSFQVTNYVMSASTSSDLLIAANWTTSSGVAWGGWGTYDGWAEGCLVVDPTGAVRVLMRVHDPEAGEIGCALTLSPDRQTLSFDEEFFTMPGGCVRFCVREVGGVYYLMSNQARAPNLSYSIERKRNLLAWSTSTDLVSWTVQRVLLYHPDYTRKGYQYPFWILDGSTVRAAVRTSHQGATSLATDGHNSNLITYHAWEGLLP